MKWQITKSIAQSMKVKKKRVKTRIKTAASIGNGWLTDVKRTPREKSINGIAICPSISIETDSMVARPLI